MLEPFALERPHPHLLLFRSSRGTAWLHVGFCLLFVAFWYGMFYLVPDMRPDFGKNAFMWIFFLAPLLGLPAFFRLVRTGLVGSVHAFDRRGRIIIHNGTKVGRFEALRHVEIRTARDYDGDETFRLLLLLSDRKEIELAHSNEEAVTRGADEIADFLGLKVLKS